MSRAPTWLRAVLPIAIAALLSVGAVALAQLGARPAPRPPPRAAEPAPEPPAEVPYQCRQPALVVPASEGCEAGRPYPHCRWQIPDPPEDAPFAIWRNTVPMHRWGRPGLVSLVLTAAEEYRARWPGEQLTVGDLDAPGPRHATHRSGVDVDLYLTHAMIARNEGSGRYPDNYADKDPAEVESLRARVLELARILATCADGQVRIYYNDPAIITPFRAWFDERGYRSRLGPPMREHNRLHRFHFHLTVPEDLEPLPVRAARAGRPSPRARR